MEENNKSYDNKSYAREIAALKSKISYLKSKRTKVCQMCGKEFAPKKSLRERYCSEECREQARKQTKHNNYLRYKQNPEFVEKNKKYLMDWRRKTGRVKPKTTVSLEEYDSLKRIYDISERAYDTLKESYDNLNARCNEVIKENQRLIVENYELRNKSFLQKLKDLF